MSNKPTKVLLIEDNPAYARTMGGLLAEAGDATLELKCYEKLATKAMQADTQDYLIKEKLDVNLLMHSIRYANERKRAENKEGEGSTFSFILPLETPGDDSHE